MFDAKLKIIIRLTAIIIKTLTVKIKTATATTDPAKIWVSVIIIQYYQCSSQISVIILVKTYNCLIHLMLVVYL